MNNLGYSYYKDLYKVERAGNTLKLVVKDAVKRSLLDVQSIDSFTIKCTNTFELYTTYPGLVLGTGYAHGIKEDGDFKIGCYFDYTLGYPIVPGSSIKGVIRSVFPSIIKEEKEGVVSYKFDNKKEKYNKEKAQWVIKLLDNINNEDFLTMDIAPKTEITKDEIERIYNLVSEMFDGKDKKGNPISIYHRDIFYDAMPVQAHNQTGCLFGDDSITPHIKEGLTYEQASLKNPVPLLFYKILSNVEMKFNFELHAGILTVVEKENLIKKILTTIGVGAKTNVGYGQLTLKPSYKGENGGKSSASAVSINANIIKSDIEVGQILEALVIDTSSAVVTDLKIADIDFKPRLIGVSPKDYKVGDVIKVTVDKIGEPMKFSIKKD